MRHLDGNVVHQDRKAEVDPRLHRKPPKLTKNMTDVRETPVIRDETRDGLQLAEMNFRHVRQYSDTIIKARQHEGSDKGDSKVSL